MYWLANDTYSFTVREGETFAIEVSVLENGPGGEMRWESEEAIAQVWIKTPSVIIEIDSVSKGRRHESSMTAFSYWGPDDMDDIDMLIMDPSLMMGGPLWEDIRDNATIHETSDSVTIEWDTWESGGGYRNGIWIWNLPDNSPSQLEVVGFVTDGGFIPSFKSELADRPDPSSSSNSDVPWMSIIGFMIIVGMAMAGYERRIMDHDLKRILFVTSTVVVVGILVMSTFHSLAFSSEKRPAPDFEIETLEGESIRLTDLRGKVVVISFSGIACSFCRPQMEEMVKVRQHFSDDDEVFFLSVNIMTGDDDTQWREFRDEIGADWAFTMDTDGMVGKFKITSMPVIVFLDKDGAIANAHQKSLLESDEFESDIRDVKQGLDIGGPAFAGGSLMFAFFVGITAFFAPCAFPLLPGFMTYQLGRLKDDQFSSEVIWDEDGNWFEPDSTGESPGIGKGLSVGIAAMIGITCVMISFALLGWLMEDFIQANLKYYTPILGIVIVGLGIVFLLHIPLPTGNLKSRITNSSFYYRIAGNRVNEWQRSSESSGSLHLGVMAYGAGYASATMGCHGPIFIAVLLLGLAGGFILTVEMILLYSLGMGICMVIVSVLVAATENTAIDTLQKNLSRINKISGFFLIIAGIWIFWTGYQAFI
jgi:cytochrome c biogenesis protein CcdA/peroxiredoxin